MPGSDQGRPASRPNQSDQTEQEITIMAARMTDQEWEAQNGNLSPDDARAQGLCWCCQGNGVLYTAFGGIQRTVPCPEKCNGGKATR